MLRTIKLIAVQGIVIAVITMTLLEALVAFGFRYPTATLIPISVMQIMHIQFDRDTIQVQPACAIYNSDVTYTLRPGQCTFANREFSNQYQINSLGVRDDEESL